VHFVAACAAVYVSICLVYSEMLQSTARLGTERCVLNLYNPDCRHLKEAGSPGLIVDPGRIVWSPYCPERELITFRH